MEVYKAPLGDINRIECTKAEIKAAIKMVQDDYSCVTRLTFKITDTGKDVYLYYNSFTGKRHATTEFMNNYEKIDSIVCRNGKSIERALNDVVKLAKK